MSTPAEKWALCHDGGRRFGMMTTNFSEVFNSVLKGARNVPITAYVQMTFYRVNDYFVLRRKAALALSEDGGSYPPQISARLVAYGVKANSHGVRVFNFQQGIVEVKTAQSGMHPHKGGIFRWPTLQIEVVHIRNRNYSTTTAHTCWRLVNTCGLTLANTYPSCTHH